MSNPHYFIVLKKIISESSEFKVLDNKGKVTHITKKAYSVSFGENLFDYNYHGQHCIPIDCVFFENIKEIEVIK